MWIRWILLSLIGVAVVAASVVLGANYYADVQKQKDFERQAQEAFLVRDQSWQNLDRGVAARLTKEMAKNFYDPDSAQFF
jgi:hypothetical protein